MERIQDINRRDFKIIQIDANDPFASDNPIVVDDPVARKIGWDSARPKDANYWPQKTKVSANTITIGKSAVNILHALLFLLPFGLPLLFGPVYFYLYLDSAPEIFILSPFGALFCLPGFLILKNEKITFDKPSGFYYRGNAYDQSASLPLAKQGRLKDIYAVQILSKVTKSRSKHSRPFTSYELNLVFKDGARTNAMDQKDEKIVFESALELGKFLGAPIWSANH